MFFQSSCTNYSFVFFSPRFRNSYKIQRVRSTIFLLFGKTCSLICLKIKPAANSLHKTGFFPWHDLDYFLGHYNRYTRSKVQELQISLFRKCEQRQAFQILHIFLPLIFEICQYIVYPIFTYGIYFNSGINCIKI